jgi:hypothetical protein
MSEHVLNFGRAAKVTQLTSVKLTLSDGCCSTAAEWNASLGLRCCDTIQMGGVGFYPRVLFMGFLQDNTVATVYIHIVLCSEHIIPAITKSHNVAT